LGISGNTTNGEPDGSGCNSGHQSNEVRKFERHTERPQDRPYATDCEQQNDRDLRRTSLRRTGRVALRNNESRDGGDGKQKSFQVHGSREIEVAREARRKIHGCDGAEKPHPSDAGHVDLRNPLGKSRGSLPSAFSRAEQSREPLTLASCGREAGPFRARMSSARRRTARRLQSDRQRGKRVRPASVCESSA